jgi:2-oxoglutarate dehydrogenase E2 component (dihydrolipoamide succinyltransferase)
MGPRKSLFIAFFVLPTMVFASDDEVPPPGQAPAPQAPAPQPPQASPQAAQPPQAPSKAALAAPQGPTVTPVAVTVPAQAVLLQQEAPKVYLVQAQATPQAAPATVQVVQAPVAQAPTVTPVTILKEKCRFCKAIGALGARMVQVGQPTLQTVNAVVTTSAPQQASYVVQQAPAQATPQALASPQGAAAPAAVIQLAPAPLTAGRRWFK